VSLLKDTGEGSRSNGASSLALLLAQAVWRARDTHLRIPFGDHPLKLERYRED